jgi:general secretion pathway protein A
VEELRMLSNFQFGNQALLQSFLIGQPEFREILQRPEMEQFRQRVAATCHIGPLDGDETQRYIEHRLKCAGASDKPTFEPAAFDAIYRATSGIPRRVNSVCDRLLLLGFLGNKTHLTADDVAEVVREFAQESTVPARPAPVATAAGGGDTQMVATAADLDVDLSKLKLDMGEAEAMGKQLAQLTADQRGDQLQRLERSLLRLERINVQTLSLLQKLVKAVQKTPDEGKK